MTNNGTDDLKKREEACIHRYLEDCRRIEGRQDGVGRRRSLLREIEEQLSLNVGRALEHYSDYAHSNDMRLCQVTNACQCSIHSAQAEMQRRFAGYLEDLALEERRLADEREERERRYKEELCDLGKGGSG